MAAASGLCCATPRAHCLAPKWLGALALLLPPRGAAGTELLPALRGADPALVATAGAMAAVNATGEEVLWRGLFLATFPDTAVRGWLWPPIGFTVWHLAPTSSQHRSAGYRERAAVSRR